MARRTKEDADATRNNIIDSAIKIFSRDGFTKSKLDDIAKDAGVTRGAIYHHFDNKLGIFYAMVDDFLDPACSLDECTIENQPLLTLHNFFIEWYDYLATDEQFKTVFEILFFKSEIQIEDMKNNQRYDHSVFIEKLTNLIKEIIDSGLFYKDLDPYEAAIYTDSQAFGLTKLWIYDQNFFDIAEMGRKTFLMMLRSLGDIEKIEQYLNENKELLA